MNNFNSFKLIREKLMHNMGPISRNIPIDFVIRPILKSNESYEYQLVYLEYIRDQRCMFTCILPEEIAKLDSIDLKKKSRNLLQGFHFLHAPTSLAEQLMAERMRVSKEGVTFYDFNFENDSLLFNYDGITYHGYLRSNGEWSIPESLNISNAIDMKRNPNNWELFSYLKDNNIYILSLSTKVSVQLTFNEDPDKCSGSTHFIIQEEFDRYEGIWWRPYEEIAGEYHLLFEEYDQRFVDQFSIPDYSSGFNTELYRYPRPGKKNAESNLKILKVNIDSSSQELKLLDILELPLKSLAKLFPEYEYLTNAGWTPDGNFVWIQLIDRLQNIKSTYLLPLKCFRSSLKQNMCDLSYAILFYKEENFQYWVPVNNNTRFLKSYYSFTKSEPAKDNTCASAILGMTISGFNHLYLVNKYWKIPKLENETDHFLIIEAETESVIPLTSGQWQVDSEKIWVNEDKCLVYFLANRDDTISNNLYRARFCNLASSEICISQVTNQDTNMFFNAEDDWAVVVTSTLHQEAQVYFMNVKDNDISSSYETVLFEPAPRPNIRSISNIFNLNLLKYDLIDENSISIPLYGLLFTPLSDEKKAWPTIHYVYGGPGVRLIKNCFNRNFYFMAQMLNSFGYAVLLCDGRGSTGRGIAFEGYIKNKMGTVELEDQIFFIRKAAEETGLIDINRVGIYGSSYGGYLTIMGLLQHSDVYKCGFSCSPVVDFKFYDTAYTERYLGIPENNPEAYRKASTLTYLNGLPSDCCRLTIAHGGQDENVHFLHTAHLMEEASGLGLDIKLLFYPTSRHRIKRKEHLDANLISFMNIHLMK